MNHKTNKLGQPLHGRVGNRYRIYCRTHREEVLRIGASVYDIMNDAFQTHHSYIGATIHRFWNDLRRYLRLSS